jgi:hypothetical protein
MEIILPLLGKFGGRIVLYCRPKTPNYQFEDEGQKKQSLFLAGSKYKLLRSFG